MQSKEIETNGVKYVLKELGFLDVAELSGITDRREHAKKMLMLSGLTEEQVNNLTKESGNAIVAAINELNGWTGFQKASTNEKN